ncbi:FadR/GntR family transcriptional regulator [Persicobacter diffluens]|uniref:GntR family transcriptional regulator n=1 Tax=Persicobacter diffluens TaxID=981 RepID=A0AAN4W3B6_9BACT|nr:GntR family transcriptional regulator [Persicobacter diffluens]
MIFDTIKVEKPADVIIRQIRELIEGGTLNAGDVLPPERRLSEQFGVGRSYVRDAIKKLEFYGVLKTLPQSGTVVAGLGIDAMRGVIANILELHDTDFHSLVETRAMLEYNAVHLAAKRRTESDLINIREALAKHEAAVLEKKKNTSELDFLFHLAICEAAHNATLKSLMMVIMPDVIDFFDAEAVCSTSSKLKSIEEHKQVLKYIEEGDSKSARKAMEVHMAMVIEFSEKKLSNKR